MTKKDKQIKKIHNEVLNLKKSPLYAYRTSNNYFPVIGEGDLDASIMFIGEAPGKNEALTAKPFCGASGRVLDELLSIIGLQRNAVYVTSIVLDRPPENRDPTPKEIEIYGPFLDRQIDIIKPKVIATLGRFSMDYIIRKFDSQFHMPISQAHGNEMKFKASYGEIIIIPLYHPAASIYNQRLKDTLKEDFMLLKRYI